MSERAEAMQKEHGTTMRNRPKSSPLTRGDVIIVMMMTNIMMLSLLTTVNVAVYVTAITVGHHQPITVGLYPRRWPSVVLTKRVWSGSLQNPLRKTKTI